MAAGHLAVIAGGCVFSGNGRELHAQRRPVEALGAGFVDLARPPAPEATIRPRRGSWDAVHPPPGYRVVLLTGGDDRATSTLVAAVNHWAKVERVRLETIAAAEPEAIDGIVHAIDLAPDLVTCAGSTLVDALSLVTASFLDQQFLVVGSQLPEPTINVTAAIWRGGSSRGREVPDTPLSFDPNTFTRQQADAAIRAGVASVLNNLTGIVISLD